MKPLTIILASLALSACAENWVKPGATPADMEAALSQCSAEAYVTLPPLMQRVMASPAGRTPVRTRCTGSGNTTNCTTTGGDYRPAVYRNDDVNEDGRHEVQRACMFRNGWQPED